MSRVLTLLTVCVVLAILRLALAALLLALAVMLLWSFVTRPRETLVFLGSLTLFGLASAQPIALIIALGIVALAVVAVAACQRSPCRPPVIDRPQFRLGNRRD